jgi:outer membrane lipopolysaccharide assembly protein LptE/RlpB
MRSLRPGRAPATAAAAAAVFCAASLLFACGYRLAGKNQLLPPQVKTIGIPPFQNSTRRAEVEQRITESVTSTFVSRGGYRTVPGAEGADAVLRGEVTGYDVSPVNVGADGRATRYEVVVTAKVELKDTGSEKVYFRSDHFIFKRQYDVSRSAATFSDQEIEAIQEVARDFAESVVTSILEGF